MNLHKCAQAIPSSALWTKHLFSQATTPANEIYFRRGYLCMAAICSFANVFGYGITFGSRIVSAIIHVKFNHLQSDLTQDAKDAGNSLYFTAITIAYVFASLCFKSYPVQLPPMPDETSFPAIIDTPNTGGTDVSAPPTPHKESPLADQRTVHVLNPQVFCSPQYTTPAAPRPDFPLGLPLDCWR